MEKTNNRFEVHTWTLCDGWINCWTVTDKHGNEQPDSYLTIKAAQAEIDEFFADIEADIKAGDREPDEGYDREEFRIFDTVNNEYVA